MSLQEALLLVTGAAIGAAFTLAVDRLKRWLDRREEENERRNRMASIMTALQLEIKEGIRICGQMSDALDRGEVFFGRIYTGWWDTVVTELAEWVKDTTILTLLHRIYHRFDLVNFNLDYGDIERIWSGHSFAQTHLGKLGNDFRKLREKVKADPKIWIR